MVLTAGGLLDVGVTLTGIVSRNFDLYQCLELNEIFIGNIFYSYQTGSHPAQNSQQFNNLPAFPAAYHQRQPYNYQNFQSRNKINHPRQLSVKQLLPEAPKVQQPAERTWVDKMGVTWTTRKVNDYKWGEREPGIMMDEYAGGPFGFDDVKRDNIERLTANEVFCFVY